jgi:exodeoxyribonuclease V beta subunit
MDLVFFLDGRIYGLDYKSNHLGDYYEDYNSVALRACMEEHHYLLQALLYAVAIHRYAKTRIEDYSYETHFGGMAYVFLRGMHPQRPGNGVYSLRPPASVVEELSRVFEEGV